MEILLKLIMVLLVALVILGLASLDVTLGLGLVIIATVYVAVQAIAKPAKSKQGKIIHY